MELNDFSLREEEEQREEPNENLKECIECGKFFYPVERQHQYMCYTCNRRWI